MSFLERASYMAFVGDDKIIWRNLLHAVTKSRVSTMWYREQTMSTESQEVRQKGQLIALFMLLGRHISGHKLINLIKLVMVEP